MQHRSKESRFRIISSVSFALGLSCLGMPAAHAAASAGKPPPPGVSFLSDFGADPRHGTWARSQVIDPDRIGASRERTHHGKPAAFVDVRPGDNPSSCCAGSERAEVLHMRSADGSILYETADSGTQYFGVSYKFPTDFDAFTHSAAHPWQIVLQLHGPDTLPASPAFALDVKYGRFVVRTNGGDVSRGNRFVQRELLDSSLNPGRWTDLMFRISFAPDASGSMTVWRRDEAEWSFREVLRLDGIATLQYAAELGIDVGPHYWKQGLYRSAMPVDNTFWMGPMARGTSFAAVERAAFNTKSGARFADFSAMEMQPMALMQVSAVPEPEHYLLWLSGLGVLAAATARSRRRKASRSG